MTNAATKKDSTTKAEAKVEETKATPAAEPTPEAKPRRKARTLAEKIAELQKLEAERAEKKEASARKKFDELVEKFDAAKAKVASLAEQLIETRGGYDFALPEGVDVTAEKVNELQVAAYNEEVEAQEADEAALDAESDVA